MAKKKRCETCYFWSEMLAGIGKGTTMLEAMCMNEESLNFNKYKLETFSCKDWEENTCGAIDDPGRENE